MNSRTKALINALAVILVLVAVLMEMKTIIIPSIQNYAFWIVVAAFGMVLVTKR
ncbi:MAG: hypothetical protein LAT68_14525 [Cyclobacteriaceae bacterium]|nr:hypothetical protein [Cyclobacteriaceae bacterium]MCH8517536.1 hypothetical protein [Cyclobacteriaceae bacterium]